MFAFLLILPTLLVVIGVVGYPWMESLRWSLHKEDMFTKQMTFVGLDNYTKYMGLTPQANWPFIKPVSNDALLFYESFGRTV